MRASTLHRLGIMPRMVISFAAVALLAGTANMIARESVRIIRTVARSPEIQSVRLQTPAPLPIIPQVTKSKMPAVLGAVERFAQASRSRANSNTAANNSDYTAARDTLKLAFRAYRGAKEPAAAWAPPVPVYLGRGEELILLSDQRRQDRTAYGNHAKLIADRIRGALDGAWSVFGRVIAKKSLIELRSELDLIRQRCEGLIAGETLDGGHIAQLIDAETALSETLTKSQSSLSKSEGAEWFSAVAMDFAAMASLRESLQKSNEQFAINERRFIEMGRTLQVELASATLSAKNGIATDNSNGLHPHAQPWLPSIAPTPPVLLETTVERTDPRAAKLMATVTMLVMLIIVAISVLTVRSVVLPVRRLIRATRQLADGQSNVRVGRGGIKELDIVAQAFDRMSVQLETMTDAYKTQQESLEHQVAERTYKLQQLAHQDPLTSLPNRRHLSALLSAAISRAQQTNRFVGVYFLDIDNFKNINDSLGHMFGDRVLMSVANRLEELVDGFGFVARLGGDEFTLVYEDADSAAAIREFGLLLANAFHKMVTVDDRDLSISVSVGASIFPEHKLEPEGLLLAADSALFLAKELGRNQLAVFTPELIASAAMRFTLEQGLRLALERSEFELAYQPEISVGRAEIGLVEALLRWRKPDGKLAKPGEFLAVAEQSGLMAEINSWVLHAALRDAATWHHGGWVDARVAINVSPRQLLDHLFVEKILFLLEKFRLPAKCIELELTESLLQTGSATIASLHVLQSHGFGIALDDFGTGYSSLTSLEQLPLSRVKLDRSLVSGIDLSARSAAIAAAIIELCAGLGLQVTAEGIERPEQFAWFASNPCILLQGFLLSDALPFDDVLPFKASVAGRLQDLLLSMPPSIRAGAAGVRKHSDRKLHSVGGQD